MRHGLMKHALAIVVLPGLVLAGCSNQSPIAPESPSAAAGGASASDARSSSPGVYTLSFIARVDGTVQEVTSLPVLSTELNLKAYVTSNAGEPAQGGAVTFEYCSFKGGPRNDITRPDEAPKEACDQGGASWVRLTSLPVNAGTCPELGTGYACMNFGIVSIPRDIGFRFRYSPQGSGIASGTSEATNFTWVPAS